MWNFEGRTIKLTDKEVLKVLAEAIVDNYVDNHFCLYCNSNLNLQHESDCPVVLAKEILNETK